MTEKLLTTYYDSDIEISESLFSGKVAKMHIFTRNVNESKQAEEYPDIFKLISNYNYYIRFYVDISTQESFEFYESMQAFKIMITVDKIKYNVIFRVEFERLEYENKKLILEYLIIPNKCKVKESICTTD